MRRFLALAIVVILALAGCSTSGGDDDAATTTTTEAADDPTTTEAADDDGPPVTVDDRVAGITEDDYIDAFATSLSDSSSGDLSFDEDTARCVAEGWVPIMTVEGLQKADVELDDIDGDFEIADLELGAEAGAELVGVLDDCGADVVAEFAEFIAEGDPEVEACVADEIDRDAFDEVLGRGFGGEDVDDDLDEVLGGAAEACGIQL